jgi:hypothetical protein
MGRLQRLRDYARRLHESIRKLVSAVRESLANTGRFLRNVLSIVATAIRRGLELLWADLIDFIKSTIRLIVDLVRWPFEHIVVPVTRWLAQRSDRLLNIVRTRDEVALGCFLMLLVIVCGVCGCLLFTALRTALVVTKR